ncbi:helix-turn-helix transcriptional regulator [Winogradskyella sp.]|uniref:helix-turn-helix transcriptional regulator n=1 Tax=Winogradskyella sp. TaxID=1883156 RepID=UPI00261AE4CD|nr:helix-turn-helix transcriptional regulator [Winogradskyella sp.]
MEQLKLNEFVRTKRKSLKMTQKEMSEKSGVGIRFIRELEKGKQTLKMDKINQVLSLFGYELGPIPINRGNEES